MAEVAVTSSETIRIALAGNPNTGKTTLFNQLTGARAHVANYPGVTVDRRFGWYRGHRQAWQVHDLPGCYSVDARAPDEVVAHHALTGVYEDWRFDVVVVLLDAAQLGRNLLLLLQIAELGLPVVAALNLVGEARDAGVEVDTAALGVALGCPVVAIEAPSGEGVQALCDAVQVVMAAPERGRIAATKWRPRID